MKVRCSVNYKNEYNRRVTKRPLSVVHRTTITEQRHWFRVRYCPVLIRQAILLINSLQSCKNTQYLHNDIDFCRMWYYWNVRYLTDKSFLRYYFSFYSIARQRTSQKNRKRNQGHEIHWMPRWHLFHVVLMNSLSVIHYYDIDTMKFHGLLEPR